MVLGVAVRAPSDRDLRCIKSILRKAEEFKKQGVEFNLYPWEDADLVLTTHQFPESILEHETRPTIVVDTSDDSMIRQSTRLLCKAPQVVQCWKLTQSDPLFQYRDSFLHLHEEDLGRFQPSLEELPKDVRSAPGWVTYAVVDPLSENPRSVEELDQLDRPIDIHFRGTVDYKGFSVEGSDASLVSKHRRRAWGQLEQFKQANPHLNIVMGLGRIPRPDYYRELLQSKIVLCPWGLGETTIREVEASLAGCFVLKPNTPWLQVPSGIGDPSWPPYYVKSKPENRDCSALYCRACKSDFSDLSQVLEHTLDEYNRGALRYHLLRNRQVFLEAKKDFVDRIIHLFSEALSGKR